MAEIETIKISKERMDTYINYLMGWHAEISKREFADTEKIAFEYFDKIAYSGWLAIHKSIVTLSSIEANSNDCYIFNRKSLRAYVKALKNMNKFVSLNKQIMKTYGWNHDSALSYYAIDFTKCVDNFVRYLYEYIYPPLIVGKGNK